MPIPSVKDPATIVNVFRNVSALGLPRGILVGVPIPEEHELDPKTSWALIERALAEAKEAGISGPEVTPFILETLARETHGESVPDNLALLESNAIVAVEIAKAFQQRLV